jgi:hypothetical protein
MRYSWVLVVLSIFVAQAAGAQIDPEPPLPTPLDSWSFSDNVGWTDDNGNAPISFTNIAWSDLGDGASLVVETNVPAWLNYPIYTTSGTTNIVLNGPGSISFWYAGGWATTNGGPGNLAQLVESGEADSSIGYFGLSIDSVGSNLWFASQDGSGDTYSLSVPISWTTNFFHFIALTYSETNVSLYLDGQLATNDPGGLTIWPDTSALQNGVYFGSDTNGNYLANGLFDWVQAYGYVLDSNMIAEIYGQQVMDVEINPLNAPYMSALSSAPSNPSTNSTTPDVITGAGDLRANGAVSSHIYGANEYQVWITNVTATVVSNGTTAISFTIEGGTNGVMYDVFATGALELPLTNAVWFWMGQGGHFTNYTINITSPNAFLVLGTPLDSDGDGLTDAYESLVSHTDPHNAYSNLDGILDGWDVLLGLNPQLNNSATPSERSNYAYTPADWLQTVSGIKNGTVSLDAEGNVGTVSQ